MTETGAYKANPARVQKAVDDMQVVSDHVRSLLAAFTDGLARASDVCGYDETGRQIYRAVEDARRSLVESGQAAADALGAVPTLVTATARRVQNQVSKVNTAVADAAGRQGANLPGAGGGTRK
ncbi:hypothetical protein NE235_36825 [Actinoallomurus spadix]|uniref:ESX-1 secretion-associated protein n=1 Tax=Actinoallomurus spadix TaxID=79912 RepID=A0ABN0XGE6_9ACTN|nr:hypothetical protein [Actinoallomurus spadix]MCO5991690.1 hypothetical protein [Actinoallomurus spadix]